VRQKVFGAKIHEPEGLLERNIAPEWSMGGVSLYSSVLQRSRSLSASQPRMMGLICGENCGEKSYQKSYGASSQCTGMVDDICV